ncbi:protein ANTAGONIST OF LIKE HETEROCHROMATIN PROTEIN 1-like [Penaeus japonicus]|uniref:protein ANTAGONIST OF LIKE HETEROCHROMATIN PROTEIN 1-like n=1 Tax=Penaeus japonicus TaxID=27405 RepID=UPI001C70F231|nr:protein ANTAGONIST OF LIKE HETEROCHROMATIN PROTEIN 1-like [Penaeus japonicus]
MEDMNDIDDYRELQHLGLHRRRRIFLHRNNPCHDLNEQEFQSRYRLSKAAFEVLFEQIRHRLPSSRDRRGLRISPRLQLLVGLRYFATGNFQLTIADTASMSQKSVSTFVARVAAAIKEIAPLHIKFPQPEREAAVMQAFSLYANMPGCIGCIDGTLIPIRSPGGPDAEVYRCRKDYFAINVMGVCDASLKFTTLGFLLGDSGYACSSYLLTPFFNPGTQERNFNASHINTRNCIERAFGVWKRRFAVLGIPEK